MDIYERLQVHLRLSRFKERTVRAYVSNVRSAAKRCNKEPHMLTGDDILFHLNALFEEGAAGPTIISHFSALKFLFLQVLNVPWPVSRIQRFGEFGAKTPRPLTRGEIVKLIDAAPTQQYRIIFALIYSSGMRISEVCNLKISDLDFTQKLIHVREGKGGKSRVTTLSTRLAGYLKPYLHAIESTGWLFPSSRKILTSDYLFYCPQVQKPISPRTVQGTFQRLVRKLGFPGIVSLHSLRHSFGTHLVEDGLSIFSIQRMMGHENIRTTLGYLYKAEARPDRFFSPFDNLTDC